MLSSRTAFPVERASPVEADANNLACEITVSGPPREGSLDAQPAPTALTPRSVIPGLDPGTQQCLCAAGPGILRGSFPR